MDNLIDWFYGQVVGFLGNFFAEMGNMGVELFDLDWVQAIVLFFSQGIMGDKELTFEGIGGWLKKHKKPKPVPAEKEG